MKLSAAQIPGFLQSPPPSVRVILIYGPDNGLVRERAEALAGRLVKDKKDPFSVTQLSGADLGSDAALLYDNCSALSLMGGRRLVWIQSAIESNAAALAKFLSDPAPGDGIILIEAGDLEKRSKLRASCETDGPLTAAIPCYVEDSAQRARTISAALETEGFKVSRDVIRLLTDTLPPDRMAMRTELEKLALFAKGSPTITIEDVSAVIADAGGAEIDDLIQAAASGDVKQTTVLLNHLMAEQAAPVALFRALQRHLVRLQLARSFMEQGAGAAEALKRLSPPVFWKHTDLMTKQLHRWNAPRLEARLAQLLDAEAAAKRTASPDRTLCQQLFVSIAAKA